MSDAPQSPAATLTPPRKTRGTARATGAADQRSRLLEAIVAVVGSDGYGGAKIGAIAARAGVSRATFYEFFTDKQACFNAAHEHSPRAPPSRSKHT